jgi:iron-sulfur cluster repair protein YtfE (RIC family)
VDPKLESSIEGATVWDESTRPSRARRDDEVELTRYGRAVGQHLVDVHDHLRAELVQLQDVVDQVQAGRMSGADARSSINEMTMRQNDWTMGAYCASYCRLVTQHHGMEDAAVFPHLRSSDPALAPVIDRLEYEHVVIHDVLERLDRALVGHINDPDDLTGLQAAVDLLSTSLLSHLSYEEDELVEPLGRLGFYSGQL